MSEAMVRVVRSREEAHEAVSAGYTLAKVLLADDRPVRIEVREDDEPLSIRQRKFFHGVLLKQIAEQVRMPDGTRYMPAVWKEYLRDLLLPAKFVMSKRPRWDAELGTLVAQKRATPRKVKTSTEDLTDRQYSDLIERTIAHATTELGVVFELDPIERDGVRYVSRRAAAKAAQREEVEA